MTFEYIQSQLIKVCPLPPKDCGIIRLKIQSEKGQTNWLNITPEQFKKIELILEGID